MRQVFILSEIPRNFVDLFAASGIFPWLEYVSYQHSTWSNLMGNFYPTRTCKHPGCDVEFQPYRSWQEFCTPDCRNSYYESYVRHPMAKAMAETEEEKVLVTKVKKVKNPGR